MGLQASVGRREPVLHKSHLSAQLSAVSSRNDVRVSAGESMEGKHYIRSIVKIPTV